MQTIDDEDSEILIPLNNDLDVRIHDTFMTHDSSGNKTVEAETLAIIVRALGLFPTEDEVKEIVKKTQKPEQPGFIHLSAFLPYIAEEINKGKYKPSPVEDLLAAFQRLDTENRGFFTKEQLVEYMTQNGEPLDEDEMAEMLEVAYDGFDKKIYYEEFTNKLWYKPKGEQDIYVLAARVEAEKPPPPVETKRRFSQMFSQHNLVKSTSQAHSQTIMK